VLTLDQADLDEVARALSDQTDVDHRRLLDPTTGKDPMDADDLKEADLDRSTFRERRRERVTGIEPA
jgi:hypothetical protein